MSVSPRCSDNPDNWPSKHALVRADLADLEARIFAHWTNATPEQRRAWVDKENRLKDILKQDDELVPPF